MTANNQYFERNMLISSQKTNTILESEDWAPQTSLSNINRFMDSSAATVENQTKINDTLTSLLGGNADMENELLLLNKKLDYQNSRPPGIGSNEVWLPTQLLMEMVKLLEEGNEIQEETGTGAELQYLQDISNNTGQTRDLLHVVSDDISKNTFFIQTLTSDNSKNLIDGNTILTTNLPSILSTLNTNLPTLTTINQNLYNTPSGEPWLQSVYVELSGNLYDPTQAQPWLQTINTNLTTLNDQIATLLDFSQKDISLNGVKTASWTATGGQFVTGNWPLDPSGMVPPNKFALFIEVNQALNVLVDYVDFYISPDGIKWYLRERFVAADFNPPPQPVCSGFPGFEPTACYRIGRNYDWCGTHMKVFCGGTIGLVISDISATGI